MQIAKITYKFPLLRIPDKIWAKNNFWHNLKAGHNLKAVTMSVKVEVQSSDTGLNFLASNPSQTCDYVQFIEFNVSYVRLISP